MFLELFGRYVTCDFRDKSLSLAFCKYLIIKTDENFNYVKHLPIQFYVRHLSANESSVLCVDSADKWVCFDSNLVEIRRDETHKLQKLVSQPLDFVINDKYVFILTKSNGLKIFDLDSFGLVKEIDVRGDQMRLVSTSDLLVFDANDRELCVFEQDIDLRLNEKVSLRGLIDAGLGLARDTTRTVSFYDRTRVYYFPQ
jgi:hypothetical protein